MFQFLSEHREEISNNQIAYDIFNNIFLNYTDKGLS